MKDPGKDAFEVLMGKLPSCDSVTKLETNGPVRTYRIRQPADATRPYVDVVFYENGRVAGGIVLPLPACQACAQHEAAIESAHEAGTRWIQHQGAAQPESGVRPDAPWRRDSSRDRRFQGTGGSRT